MSTLALTIPIIGFAIPLNVVVTGAIIGTTYALAGMGLTLTYQSDRVLNFAQGAMGAVPGLFVASMVVDHGMNYWVALLAALVIGAGSGALIQIGVIHRLRRAPRLVAMIATIAVAQLLLIPNRFLIDLNYTQLGTKGFPVPFHAHVSIAGVRLDASELLILVVAPAILVLLTVFLTRTSVGLASRATAENAEAAETSGIPTQQIAVVVWSIAGALTAVAAVLFGPTQPVISGALTGGTGGVAANSDLLLRGLGAAMIGGLLSLPQVFVAGIGIGVLEALVRWNYPRGGAIQLLVVAVIVVSLLARRDLRQLARGGEESTWSLAGGVRALPQRIRRLPQVRAAHAALITAALVAAVVLPMAGGTPQRILYSAILIYVVVSLSLVVLTGWAGQVSLGHFTFVALGAIVGGRMAQLGYPVFATAAFAAAGGAVAAFFVGLPALRVRGLFLAVTTLAFAVFVDGYLVQQHWLVQLKGATSSLQLFRPKAGGIDFQDELTFYWVVLAATILALVLVHRMRRTGVSRRLMAVRDNELMAAALSVSPSSAKLTAFVVSGTMASLAGYLYGLLLVNYGSANLTNPTLSLTMVTMVIVGGSTSITGAILGALYIRGLPYFIHSDWVLLLTSGGGLLAVLLLVPGGLASLAFRLRDRVVAALAPGVSDEDPAIGTASRVKLEPAPTRRTPHPEVPPPLLAAGVSVRYGGITALDDVTIRAEQGEIVGLIGPNGAGKTTLFDVLTGLVEPGAGRVHLHGEDVTEQRPEDRAVLGLGRSFQQARLFDELTVGEAIAVALERDEPTELLPSLLGLPPARAAERRKALRADELVDLVGLRPFADKKASELSTGTRRIAELACIVALGADVILLDEPTGGVAQREVEALAGVLRQIRDHLDATVVVVAHDLPLIMGLVDRVYVLSSGQVIAEGPPSILVEDPAVVAAYLGTEPEQVAGRLPEQPRPPARERVLVPAAPVATAVDPSLEEPEPRRRWLDDPNLDMLTPGQRYTAVVAVLFVAALVTIGARGSGPAPFVLDRPAAAGVAASATATTTTTTTAPAPTTSTTATTVPPAVDAMTVSTALPPDTVPPPDTTSTTGETTTTTAPPTTSTTAPPTTSTTLLPIPPLG